MTAPTRFTVALFAMALGACGTTSQPEVPPATLAITGVNLIDRMQAAVASGQAILTPAAAGSGRMP